MYYQTFKFTIRKGYQIKIFLFSFSFNSNSIYDLLVRNVVIYFVQKKILFFAFWGKPLFNLNLEKENI